jgi:adenine-specific DNA-methyltransferase
LWYARDVERLRYRQLFREKIAGEEGAALYYRALLPDGRIVQATETPVLAGEGSALTLGDLTSQGYRTNTTVPLAFRGRTFSSGRDRKWKCTVGGLHRLVGAERIFEAANSIRYIRFVDDFPVYPVDSVWQDTGTGNFTEQKLYVVQTGTKVVERCLLMTTDPGDLVLDPTCGSGTTAYIAEQWGRRWITINTSRVALALARQRLMMATFPHYAVRGDDASDGKANPAHGFNYRTVPHITLKSIAQNVALDPIFEKHQEILDARLADVNRALGTVTPELRTRLERKLAEKQKAEGRRAITDADRRRWLLPEREWREWEVPFDTDPDWPAPLRDALTAYRAAWRAKMDEVNATIAASAEQEELVDQPEVERNVVRVAGPFTMEAVMPAEHSDIADPGFAGEPAEELDTFDAGDVVNAEAFVDKMLRLLAADGVRFPDNRTLGFTRLGRIEGGHALHGEGEWGNGDAGARTVVVSIGPEHGPVTAYQVEEALREANRRGADDVVFAGFSFDGAAQAAIQDDPHPRVRAHLAHIAPDVQMGDLLKTTPNSQLFSVFGLPRAELQRVPGGEGEWVVDMQGVDIYDPVRNTIHATRADKVAAWFLDTDYDGRTFCITQAFFPDRSAWNKLERALRGTIDPERFDALTGTVSLPFRPGKHKRVAVKVIDPRGNDVMKVSRPGS